MSVSFRGKIKTFLFSRFSIPFFFVSPNRVLPCEMDYYKLGPFKLMLYSGLKSAGIILKPVSDSNLKCLNRPKTTRKRWQMVCSENNAQCSLIIPS